MKTARETNAARPASVTSEFRFSSSWTLNVAHLVAVRKLDLHLLHTSRYRWDLEPIRFSAVPFDLQAEGLIGVKVSVFQPCDDDVNASSTAAAYTAMRVRQTESEPPLTDRLPTVHVQRSLGVLLFPTLAAPNSTFRTWFQQNRLVDPTLAHPVGLRAAVYL